MLKKLIASLDEVDSKYHALYTEQEDGTFKLDVEIEGEDLEGLKRNQSKLKQEKIKLKEKLEAIENELNSKLEKELEEKGEYKTLLEKKEQEMQTKLELEQKRADQAYEVLKKTLRDAELSRLALELAGERAPLITPHLKDRVVVNEVDGDFKVQYLDVNGNPVNDSKSLVEEFKSNELFAPILQGRQSSGGGAQGGSGSGGTAEYDKYFNPDSPEYSPTKQMEVEDNQPEVYKALVTKYKLDDVFNS